jgi:hypothetical protein
LRFPDYAFFFGKIWSYLNTSWLDFTSIMDRRYAALATGMQGHWAKLPKVAEAISMSPGVAAISNIVSALPVASATTQATQRGTGGFAATLAAARNLSRTPETSDGPGGDSEPAVASGSAGSLNSQNRSAGIPTPKKLAGSNSAAVPASAAGNFVPTLIAVPPSWVTGNPGLNSGLNFGSSLDPAAVSQSANLATVAPSSGSLGNSPGAGTAGASSPDSSAYTKAAAANTGLANTGGEKLEGSEESFSSGQPTLLVSNTPNSDSVPTKQSEPDIAVSHMSVSDKAANLNAPSPRVSAQSSTPQALGGLSRPPASETDKLDIAEPPQPTLLADSTLSGATLLNPAASAETSDAGATTAISSDAATQAGTQAQTPANPMAALLSGQAPASAIASSVAQFVPLAALPRISGIKTAVAAASAKLRGNSSAAETTTTVASTDSSAEDSSGLAGQTPFSVFFSDAGAGTKTAASALPKMILPPANSALHETHMENEGGTGSSPQASGAQGGVAQNSPVHSANAASGGVSGSVPDPQAAHKDADVAASVQAIPLAAEANQTPAAPNAALVTPVLPQPATGSTETLPKSTALPAAPTSGPEAPLSSSGETLVGPAPGPVQMAQMVNRAEQSDMRIGMNTSAFGSVDVRTTVHANDVSLVIGSEKGDLRTLLANDLPAITNTLQQQSLRLNSVNFMQGFAFSNNFSGGGNSQQQAFVPQRPAMNSMAAGKDDLPELPETEFGGGSRSLSILA